MLHRASAFVAAILMAVMSGGPATADEFTEPDRHGTIDVVDQGQSPLHTLRYDWTVGDGRAVRFTITRAETFAIDGQPVSRFATSPFIIDTVVTVTSAFDDGMFEVLTEVVAAELVDPSPPDVEASVLAASLETLVGMAIRERYDDRGNRSEVEVSDPIDEDSEPHPARDAVPSIIEHMVLQLPAEPVGDGGTWEVVTQAVDGSGMKLVTTARNTVVAFESDGTFVVEATETADATLTPQNIEASGFAPGALMVLDTIEAGADSVSHLDLTSPLPAYVGAWSMAFDVELEAEGSSTALATSADTELTIEPDGLPLPSAAS